ncbi:BRO family protein [Candidatus Magnetominusculus dajiuhuensis]|uniref:BRO family protein n=1 Tax=Candidatus Magnetominusculus dajiuhuensis TaxID=3137712 RepID=UPI003B430212
MDDNNIFSFNEDNNFEDSGQNNGIRYWLASDLMVWLGYSDFSVFKKSINKAMSACETLNIPIEDNFVGFSDVDNSGKVQRNYKLTRFACFMVSMNGDIKKPQVAKAQIYFATIAETFRSYLETSENVDRILIREEISDKEKSLSASAHQAGVENYPYFQNAGYRGMYNMNLNELKIHKGIDIKKSLLNFMGKEELAANLFRITQTEAKIKNENINGQNKLERTAYSVGKEVRDTMVRISGNKPEDLPISEEIKDVSKKLRKTNRKFIGMDKTKPE